MVSREKQYRVQFLSRLEKLWRRRPDTPFLELYRTAAHACVMARLEGHPAPEG